jgi:hypothetical protein
VNRRTARDLWEFLEVALAVSSVVFITWLIVFMGERV